VPELAENWHLSPLAVRKLFEKQPGVVIFSHCLESGAFDRFSYSSIGESYQEALLTFSSIGESYQEALLTLG
jgi:hypothetical protein